MPLIKLRYFPFVVAIILSRFCLCHVLPYFIKRNQRPTSHTQLKKQLLHKEVSIQRRRKPCYGFEIQPKSKTLQRARSRGVTRAVFYPLISLAKNQNKRFYVMEIVLPLGFADAIFGGREATTGNASAVRRLVKPQCRNL